MEGVKRRGRLAAAVLVGGASLIAAVATAGAYEPVGADFRISNVGTDADAARGGFNPAVAYNPTANEYLVTWVGDGLATDGELEIFGQRVSAAGAELGADFRISTVGTDGVAAREGARPAVAYNATANEYLVTWTGDGLATNDEFEIFGQRVSAAGAELGADFRISNVGTDADALRDGLDPAVAYNATANEYLVTWEGDGLATDNEFEIFGQRVSAAGAELAADFRISNVGTDGVAARGGFNPAVAYSATANEYLVTWDGDGLATDDEFEIFGQRVSSDGSIASTRIRISNVGTDTDAARGGFNPAVAYNTTANEYLVTWDGDGLATNDEFEIFGQRVSAAGTELGADFRISNVGTDADAARGGSNPAVAYNATANEYLVTWHGDGLATDDEFEIFGRRLAQPAVPPPDPGPGGGGGGAAADTNPPDTTITAGPKAKTKKKTASFTFSSSEPGSTFECKLDKGSFEPCTSPRDVKVKKGKHSFEVRATDAAGNVDPTPATRSWKVKKKRKK